MLKKLAAVLAIALLFASCSPPRAHGTKRERNDASRGGGIVLNDIQGISDSIFEEILVAIENRDGDTILAMFSERAIADNGHMDEALEYLFGLFDGEVVSWQGSAYGSSESIRDGNSSQLIYVKYVVETENGRYLFWLLNYENNTIQPDMQGLYTIHGIDDADEDAFWGTWQACKAPGIYMPGAA